MGVSQALTRLAVRRVHVMVVEVPGHWTVRAALERRLSARKWRAALSPADADMLVVCGRPGPELVGVIDHVWDQMPGPRLLVEVDEAQAVDAALDRATTGLLDVASQHHDARQRAQEPDTSAGNSSDHGGDGDHDGMDHGQMKMAPAGIALAQGGEDRDRLEMDVLHVRLGPILPHWPPGLVVRCALQGDAIAGTEVGTVDSRPAGEKPASIAGTSAAARQCDEITDLLALAGWQTAAGAARRARDLLLTQPDTGRADAVLHRLRRTLCRSRLLRWSLRGLGPLTGEDVEEARLPVAFVGDTYDRLLARAASAAQLASDPSSDNVLSVEPARAIEAIPDIVDGLDIGAARLVIAGLGIDTASTVGVSVSD